MQADPEIIERIYEAAALLELWSNLLQTIAERVSCRGGVIVAQYGGGASWTCSPAIERDVSDYFAAGWRLEHIAGGIIGDNYPGFRAETDYQPVELIHRMPVHTEFFGPRGYRASTGTIMQGARDDLLMCIFNGFASHAEAKAANRWLDVLRAPLGRALSISARLRDKADSSAIAALKLAGVPAAVIASDGRLRATNEPFVTRLGASIDTRKGRLRFVDRRAQAQLDDALVTNHAMGVRSLAVAGAEDTPAFALHLIPLQRAARDVFGADGMLVLLAEAANASFPKADLLRLLFDLTPAEARVTRALMEGRTQAEVAEVLGITEATARTHLRRIFGKTGVTRQAELVRLLAGVGAPNYLRD